MKTCIITGAGSGIGRATALETANRSDYQTLVLIGRNLKKIEETAALIGDLKKVHIVQFDLMNIEGIPQLVHDLHEKTGSIDCLLNIAGYTDPQPALNTDYESLVKTYDVNVFAPFLLIRECVKYMKHNRSSKILNVASTAGITPRPGWISYASSKAAIISMSQTLSEELAEYGISVYCISPGRCATPLREILAPDEDPTTIMQPKDVAEIIGNLISESEKCLDGQNIVVRKKL